MISRRMTAMRSILNETRDLQRVILSTIVYGTTLLSDRSADASAHDPEQYFDDPCQ